MNRDQEQIRAAIAEQHRAICRRDVDSILSYYSRRRGHLQREAALRDAEWRRLAPRVGDITRPLSRFVWRRNSKHGRHGQRQSGSGTLPDALHETGKSELAAANGGVQERAGLVEDLSRTLVDALRPGDIQGRL
jgi:hypothetical protein